jgi:hypothetical protein
MMDLKTFETFKARRKTIIAQLESDHVETSDSSNELAIELNQINAQLKSDPPDLETAYGAIGE